MCNYCMLAEKLDTWGDDLGNWDIDCGEMGLIDASIKIQPEDSKLFAYVGFGYVTSEIEISINFCPMCGRSLKNLRKNQLYRK